MVFPEDNVLVNEQSEFNQSQSFSHGEIKKKTCLIWFLRSVTLEQKCQMNAVLTQESVSIVPGKRFICNHIDNLEEKANTPGFVTKSNKA